MAEISVELYTFGQEVDDSLASDAMVIWKATAIFRLPLDSLLFATSSASHRALFLSSLTHP